MTLHLELDPATEASLTEAARNKGIDPETYALDVLRENTPARTPTRRPPTLEDFRAMLDKFAQLGPRELPFDDQNWSREIIYGDHP